MLHFVEEFDISGWGVIAHNDVGIWEGALLFTSGLMLLTYTKQLLMCVHLQKHMWRVLGKFQPLTVSAGLCPVFSSVEIHYVIECFK